MSAAATTSSPGAALNSIQSNMRDLALSKHTPFGVQVPKFAVPVTATGFVLVPAAYGTQAQIVQYQAKPDYYVLICALVFGYVNTGGGPAPNPGDATFAVDIDRPLGAATGYPCKDYGAFPFLAGSFSPGDPWPCDFRFKNGQIIRVKGTPVANMGLGAGNVFTAALLGYEWQAQGFEG